MHRQFKWSSLSVRNSELAVNLAYLGKDDLYKYSAPLVRHRGSFEESDRALPCGNLTVTRP